MAYKEFTPIHIEQFSPAARPDFVARLLEERLFQARIALSDLRKPGIRTDMPREADDKLYLIHDTVQPLIYAKLLELGYTDVEIAAAVQVVFGVIDRKSLPKLKKE